MSDKHMIRGSLAGEPFDMPCDALLAIASERISKLESEKKILHDDWQSERCFIEQIEGWLGADCRGSIGTGIKAAIDKLRAATTLDESQRGMLAQCLRIAATQFDADSAQSKATRIGDQFRQQAVQARELADRLDQAESISIRGRA